MSLTQGQSSLSTAMKLLWERHGKPREGLTAEMYWNALEEVAKAPLQDSSERHAEGTEDTWEALAEAMGTQGLALSQSLDDKGVTRIHLAPSKG